MLISTIFTFVSCTRVKNKDLKVNILALTESKSVYFIQKADTIENKCYIVTGDNDKISITVERNGKEIDTYAIIKKIENKKMAGISILNLYDYDGI